MGAVPSEPWRRGRPDLMPYREESDRRRKKRVQGWLLGGCGPISILRKIAQKIKERGGKR
jgi:hypothetical protein